MSQKVLIVLLETASFARFIDTESGGKHSVLQLIIDAHKDLGSSENSVQRKGIIGGWASWVEEQETDERKIEAKKIISSLLRLI